MSQSEIVSSSSRVVRSIGIVKWFNKKQGYGFIRVLSGEHLEKDVFVHYSTIRSKDASDYKYLVQGEYVEFVIEKAIKENHELNAVDITGIFENPTLCETRRNASFREEEEGTTRPDRPRYSRSQTQQVADDVEGYKRVVRGKSVRRPGIKPV